MSDIKLSKQCLDKLHWYCEDEAFILDADFYVKLARRASKHKKHDKAQAQKRIDKAKKAFAALTEQDKHFLDRQIDGHISYISCDNNEKIPSCKNMMLALDRKVPPDRASHSRRVLLHFACRELYFHRIDIKSGNTELAKVLEILIKEAGVTHDAVDIAGEAVEIMDRKATLAGEAVKNS